MYRMYTKISDEKDFVRDEGSQALINNNVSKYNLYKARREKQKHAEAKANELESLKQEVQELKQLVMQLVQRNP